MSESQQLKHHFGAELARDLGERIQAVYPAFDAPTFAAQVAGQVEPLELKARVAVFAEALRAHLPSDYPEALRILCAILGPEHTEDEGMFTHGYHLMPVAYFVEVYGLDHFEPSLAALNEITRRHTAEFAIRPFLLRYPERTLEVLRRWSYDDSSHLRRLVSEGTRPRLPWAAQLSTFITDPAPVLALLEPLKADPSPYVRRSVANSLNDIIKDHPALVLDTLTRWNENASEETREIIRHALRNLVKQGDPAALRLLDFDAPQVTLKRLALEPKTLRVGDDLKLSLTLHSQAQEPQNLIVDYIMHFVKANGQTSPRVFKLRTLTLEGSGSVTLRKKHSFKPVTTRRYYSGKHRLEVQVNGVVVGGADFTLKT